MKELQKKAEKLFTYALPLLITEFTHYGSDDKGFTHFRRFPDENDNRVVMLNNDTLYSLAFTQLARTPYVIHIPENIERYYLFPILNGYTEVIYSIGTRTPELGSGDYIFLYGNEPVPAGYENYKVLRSQTSLNAVLLRIETRGSEDYEKVNKIQDSITIRPVYEDKLIQVRDSKGIIPPEYAENLSVSEFLKLFTELSVENPIDDDEIREIITLFGLDKQTDNFSYDSIDDEYKTALESGFSEFWRKVKEHTPKKENLHFSNGWITITGGLGAYGNDYLTRASAAWGGWGANIVQDSVYASAQSDSKMQPFDSGKKYRIHFNDGEYPHAAVFWSVSLYGAESKFPVSSKNGRHKINSHDVNNGTVLKNSDGSLDIYLSREEPEDEHERKNWLPSPPDEKSFLLVIRIYWPDDDTLSGKWNAPVIDEI